jgi:hypothetical protein
MLLEQLSGETTQTSDSNPALRAVALNEMRGASQIFEYAQFYSFLGNADNPKKAATEAGGSQRAIGSDYAGVEGAPSTAPVALAILGDKVLTDLAYERRGGSVESERIRELQSFARGLGRYFMHQLINGTGDNNQMAGLKALIAAAYVTALDVNGLQVVAGNDSEAKAVQATFIEALDSLIASVGAGAVLIMPSRGISRLSNIARDSVKFDDIDGVFGQVTSYNGTPIINAGYSKDKVTPVLPFTEACGTTATGCASIYCVKFGEKEDTTIGTNVGLQVRDLGLVGVHYTTLVEMDAQATILAPTSAQRLKGFML